MIQQVFHYLFFYNYWYIQKHEGQRDLNSQAQKDIFELAVSRGEVSASDANPSEADAQLRASQAMQIWNHEKGYALGVILVGFLFKVSTSDRSRRSERSQGVAGRWGIETNGESRNGDSAARKLLPHRTS